MRKRLTIAIVAVVAGALVVAGLGTLLLARRAAEDETRRDLVEQARALVANPDVAGGRVGLPGLRRPLRLEGVELVRLGPGGCGPVRAPSLLGPEHCEALAAGREVSGSDGDLVWAAAPVVQRGRPVAAAVLSRRVPGLGPGTGYLLTSGALALVAAAAVAGWLGRRITRPLADAEAATRRIAAGDFGARVPALDGAYPELASLSSSIDAMAESLARAKRLERQFLLSVSHELRTPLTSVRGYAEAIADGTAADPARAAEVIGAESRRLERLVGDLLDLAKLDARRFSLAVADIDAGSVVNGVAEAFGPAFAAAGVGLSVEVPEDGTLSVRADGDRLAQVVANLVENAFKFASGEVTVGGSIDGGSVVVAVEDDGPGIPAEDVPRVFERMFQSARTPARSGVGSGLGLAIVSELVSAMGGQVSAASPVRDGRGTRLEVRLPAT